MNYDTVFPPVVLADGEIMEFKPRNEDVLAESMRLYEEMWSRGEFRQNVGQHVMIHRGKFLGVFGSFREAANERDRIYPDEAVLIREVSATTPHWTPEENFLARIARNEDSDNRER